MKKDVKQMYITLTKKQKEHAKTIKNKTHFENYVLRRFEENNKNPQLKNEQKTILKKRKHIHKIAAIATVITLFFAVTFTTAFGVKSYIQNRTDTSQPFEGGNLSVLLQGNNHILAERKPGTASYKVITTAMYGDNQDVRSFTVKIPEGQGASISMGGKEYDQLTGTANASQLSKVNVIAYDKDGKVLGRGTGHYQKEADKE